MSDSVMNTFRKPVKAPKPMRLLVTAAATPAFYDIDNDELRSQVVERLWEICRGWTKRPDLKFIASFDDDLMMVGDPSGHKRWSIYILLDVDEFDTVVDMVDEFRHGSVALWRYFTVCTSLGRPFWPIEGDNY
jgi:hypothetical protein